MNPWEEDLVVDSSTVQKMPWEEELAVEEIMPETLPWEENLEVRVPRGSNVGGAVRNVLQSTPFAGTWADEIEAGLRAPFSEYDYETLRKNAEESALGNIENTGYGKALSLGTNLAENLILTGLMKGKNLTPNVSAIQGAIEGLGRGSDIGERVPNALAGAALGYIVPSAFNRILPTKTIQKYAVDKMAKSSNMAKQIIGKAIQQGTTPEDIIAKEVPRGMRSDLWARLRHAYVGKSGLREPVLKQASETLSKPYSQYIKEEIERVSPKFADRISKAIEKIKLDELGDDIVGEFDPRQYVMDAVNKVMRSATEKEKTTVASTVADAIAKRGVAKKLTTVAVERPIGSVSGSIFSILRRMGAPLKDIADKGLLREVSVGTPNYVPTNWWQRNVANRYTPDWVRGLLDAAAENYERRTIK